MKIEKRYVVTLDAYVYASSDGEVKLLAEKLAQKLQQNDDNKAGVISIHEVPFGTIGQARKLI